MPDLAERAEHLGQFEDINVLHSALFSAYEAELSEIGWPGDSKAILTNAFEELESLTKWVK